MDNTLPLRKSLVLLLSPWVLPAGALLVSIVALQVLYGGVATALLWLSWTLILLAIWFGWRNRASAQLDVFEPLYLVLAFFLFAFPTRAMLALWLEESWLWDHERGVFRALLATGLGFFCFAWGYRMRRPSRVTRLARRLDGQWDLRRLNLVSIAYLLISLASFAVVWRWGGSLDYFILVDPEIKGPEAMSGWFFYLLWASMFVQVGALVQLCACIVYRRQKVFTTLYFAFALASSILVSRISTLLLLMMAAILYHFLRRSVRFWQIAVLSALAVAYLAIAGLYREWISPAFDLQTTAEWSQLAAERSDLVVRYVVANFDQLSNFTTTLEVVPAALPYQWGATFTPLLFKPIPRAVMPSKPLSASAVLAQEIYPSEYQAGFVPTFSVWAEWYLNFSWLGIALGMALMGAVCSVAYRTVRAKPSPGRVLLYSTFAASLLIWVRGDFNTMTTFLLFYTIPMFAALWYATSSRQGNQAATLG